ncbi:MAG: glucose-1-phosphate cytidylyltransferase [Ruminococcus sp.]|jgi:glucose-1-phosphate cytidylyltransferase|nr:glucose-1-phosphate cytidylyltransferase [Ruminococcus sp.]
METVIFAGGFGTRISEESHLRPKPMVDIGGQPILWHIMKYYAAFGHTDFIICAGYKSYVIKEYFADYYLHTSNVTFDFRGENKMVVHNSAAEPWKVTIVDTGLNAMTGCRLKRVEEYVKGDRFFLTYGDGVSDIDLNALQKAHENSDNIVTLSSVQPPERYGVLEFNEDRTKIKAFVEKQADSGNFINAGFMECEREIFALVEDDINCVFERKPIETAAAMGKLGVHIHNGFWQCMDTKREHDLLTELWETGKAKWRIWNN